MKDKQQNNKENTNWLTLKQLYKIRDVANLAVMLPENKAEAYVLQNVFELVSDLLQSLNEAEKAAKDTATSITDIKRAVGSLTEVVVATKALSFIKDMGTFALQTADNFQTARNQFGVLLGDMEAGAGLFSEIKAFNDVTPFDLDTLTQATNVLVAAKVPLADLQDQLAKFGDLSQGNSERLTSYVNAFSRAAAKGKADMQVLNTYLNQGVPILDALARNFSVTTEEIMEMSSKGQISFTDFSKALDELTAAGGQYFGGMELASKSLSAMQEGLNEAVNSLAASFGEMMLPVAIEVAEVLTKITNAINESPIFKGLFAGAIITLTGYLSAMAVKAGVALAAQMKLNFAIGALNPAVLASTIAVAGLVAGYTAIAAKQQEVKREGENFALQQLKNRDSINEAAAAIERYRNALSDLTNEQIRNEIHRIESLSDIPVGTFRILHPGQYEEELAQIEALNRELNERRTSWIDQMFGNTQAAKIERINQELDTASQYLSGANLSDRTKLLEIVKGLDSELARLLNKGPDIHKMAADWKAAWAEIWNQFQADLEGDPFYRINRELQKTLDDAAANHVLGQIEGSENWHVINQIKDYYDAQRNEIRQRLADEEAQRIEVINRLNMEEMRLQSQITKTRIDDIQYELQVALGAINELEEQMKKAAGDCKEEIARIEDRFNEMREDIEIKFKVEIDKTKLEEARESVRNWQEELSDSLLTTLIDLEMFGEKASVIISELSARFIELSASSALSGFEEFGRALGEGENAAESLNRALAQMAQQILRQLPMMFLQAGLQLVANGQWPLGLGFIAAAGSSAIISGYVSGASSHAQGGVFDEYGQAAKAYAAGGAFTNQIVSTPTYFAHGGGFGLMGEAGPEAIMPLARMPNGNLGIQTMGNDAKLMVNIYNYSGAEVRQEETEGADGSKHVDVFIGEIINKHVSSGKMDRIMNGRYGVRVSGV